MAATAISLQFRRRRGNTSILHFQNPISLHLFSSIADPSNNSGDQTPPPSQSQTSLSSYFMSDLKSNLKQQRPESLQEPYRKNVMATEGGKLTYDSIRESLKQYRQKNNAQVNKGNDFSGGSKLNDSLFHTIGLTFDRLDEKSHQLFVDLCVEEVRKGHRPNTTLDKVGWVNVQKEIATRTGRNYTIQQLKNYWDLMKTDWQLFKKLKLTFTGVWNEFRTESIDAWWDKLILENPELKKIRKRDLFAYQYSYDVLFGDIVATGEKAGAPNQQSGIRRDSMCNEEFDPTPQEETRKEGSGDSDEDLATPILSPTSYSGKSKVSSASKRKMSGAELVREVLDGIVRALTCKSTATTAANEEGSYVKALDMLDSMDGVEPMSSLYHFGQQFLGKKENRVLWFKSRNDEYRLSALKYNYEQHLRNSGSGKFSYDMLGEMSFMLRRQENIVEVNKGNDFSSGSKLTDSVVKENTVEANKGNDFSAVHLSEALNSPPPPPRPSQRIKFRFYN